MARSLQLRTDAKVLSGRAARPSQAGRRSSARPVAVSLRPEKRPDRSIEARRSSHVRLLTMTMAASDRR